ncbi:MAG: hypothetical protein QM723_32950 [Myxococcaceae bacterium]
MRSLLLPLCLAFAACGPAGPDKALGASIGATPASISASQPTTVLKLLTWDENGNPGVGTAHFANLGGALLEQPDVPLVDGAASITFRCMPGSDLNCQGAVQIDGSWRGTVSTVFVQVATP